MRELSFAETVERLVMYGKGMLDQEIADKLFVCRQAINCWRNNHKLPSQSKRKRRGLGT